MKKVNKKIYSTLDYKNYAMLFSVYFCLLVFAMALFIAFIISSELVAFIIFPIIYGSVLGSVSVYYGYKLFYVLIRSNEYTFITLSMEYCSIDKSSIEWYKQHWFSVKVFVDGKEYTSNKVVSAADYAEFEEDNKVVVGVDAKKGVIVIVRSAI